MSSIGNPFEHEANNQASDLAFEMIFSRHYAGLVYFSYTIIGSKSEAEDIVQDAFVSYWNHQNDVLKNLNTIKSFLYTSVRNASLNLLKRQKVIHKFQDQLPAEPVEERTIENEMIRSEVLSEIQNAIDLLPNGCRQIIIMSYLHGHNNHEIAELLDISINTVKTQKQRAMMLLRQKLTIEAFWLFLLFVN